MSERLAGILVSSFTRILIPGIKVTIPLTLLSFVFGCIIALFLALVQIANVKGLKQFARFYIWVFRGTPLIVQLFIIFFGLPSVGIILDAFPSAVTAFALNLGAYNAEIFRSAIQAVPEGQTEAAYMVGLSYRQTMDLPRTLPLPPVSQLWSCSPPHSRLPPEPTSPSPCTARLLLFTL